MVTPPVYYNMTGQTVLIISSKEGIDMPENEILTNRTAKVSIRGAEYTITSKGLENTGIG